MEKTEHLAWQKNCMLGGNFDNGMILKPFECMIKFVGNGNTHESTNDLK